MSRNMALHDGGHHDRVLLYPLYNLYCKYRTKTSLNYNRCYVSLLIATCYEEKINKNHEKKNEIVQ